MQPKKIIVQLPKAELPEDPVIPKMSKEELVERDKWERFIEMARKGRIDSMKSFLEKQPVGTLKGNVTNWTGQLPDWVEDHKVNPTLLHVAASNDQPEIVRWLLVDLRVDPTLAALSSPSDDAKTSPQRTAYECASSRGVRNVFRRAFADHPNLWNWMDDARVPSQLTEEMEAVQNAKKSERKNKLKDKLRERAAEREMELENEIQRERAQLDILEKQQEEARRMSNSTTPKRLGGAAPKAVLEQTQLKGLSEEAKLRIERERRARAAEARLMK